MGPCSLLPAICYRANGIRTRVWALRGPRPSPLDDSAWDTPRAAPFHLVPPPHACLQARRESNPQPPVLETGALPIELLAFVYSAPLARQKPGSLRSAHLLRFTRS